LTPDGLELVKWEQEFLGVELIESQFPGAGVGVATSAATTIKKVKVHCCYETYCVVNGKKKKLRVHWLRSTLGGTWLFQNLRLTICSTQSSSKITRD